MAQDSLIIELTGDEDKVARFLGLLEPFGIIEIARPGGSPSPLTPARLSENLTMPAKCKPTGTPTSAPSEQDARRLGYGSQATPTRLTSRTAAAASSSALYPAQSRAPSRAARLQGLRHRRGVRRADVIMVGLPDMKQAACTRPTSPEPLEGQDAPFQPRPLRPFRAHQAAQGHRRHHGRAQGPGHMCAGSTSRQGDAGAGRGLPEPLGKGQAGRAAWRRARLNAAGVFRPPSRRRRKPTCSASRLSSAAARAALVQAGFETLVEAATSRDGSLMPPRAQAHRDLMYESGIAGMRFSVSKPRSTANHARAPRRQRGDEARCKKILKEIQTGKFTASGSRNTGSSRSTTGS